VKKLKIVISPDFTSSHVAFYENIFQGISCFAKQFTKTGPAPTIELFMELKPPKISFTSEVELCQTRPYSDHFGQHNLVMLFISKWVHANADFGKREREKWEGYELVVMVVLLLWHI